MYSNYFDSLQGKKVQTGGYLLQHMQRIEDIREILKHYDDIDVQEAYNDIKLTLDYCHRLLQKEYKKEERPHVEWEYKETDGIINPRGKEVHVPRDFILLQDDKKVDWFIKLYAHHALMDLNRYYRYLNKLSIEENKYVGHRRAIHKLDPDIELPKTPGEIFKGLEDDTRAYDPEQFRMFLNALGKKRRAKRNEMEKDVADFAHNFQFKDKDQ